MASRDLFGQDHGFVHDDHDVHDAHGIHGARRVDGGDLPSARPPRTGGARIGALLGHVLLGMVVTAGLLGTILLARPALDVEHQPPPVTPEAGETP
ncbi:hypothetical protein ACTWP5_16410 [Streptomyces sp. 4N509B]|uniref:hypothetical protein n=1 Tax=Streptomyces sp. 4N509B TaxID=3457413 RepID=UPI003FD297FE